MHIYAQAIKHFIVKSAFDREISDRIEIHTIIAAEASGQFKYALSKTGNFFCVPTTIALIVQCNLRSLFLKK